MKLTLCSVVVILGAVSTAAEAKSLPADQHQPAVMFNLPTVWIQVSSQDDRGYTVQGDFLVWGATSKTDRLRFDWKSGGKVVGTGKCESDYRESAHTLIGRCKLDTAIKAVGPIDIDLVYTDDQQEKDYLVTTLKTTIKHWKGIGKTEYWGHVPDDLLAVAFVYHQNDSSGFRTPNFEFWSTRTSYGGDSPTFRCTVNGTKLPDFTAHLDGMPGGVQSEIESGYTTEKANRTYSFAHISVQPGFFFGVKENSEGRDVSKLRMAIDNPGKWDCFLRVDGKSVREFLFTVNDKGMIAQSEMQSGGHAVPTLPSTVLIEMKIPKDGGFDQRIRPDAIKKSIGFGVPWPDSPIAKQLQGSLPPASGLPD